MDTFYKGGNSLKIHYENKPIQIYWKVYYQIKNEDFQI